MKEIWIKLPFNPLYEVSNKGRIKSNKFGKERILKGKNVNGYIMVAIEFDGVKCDFRVHRLVAEIFVKNPDNKRFVNHKDGIKNNNDYRNLEWVTHQENLIHYHSNQHNEETCALCRKHKKHIENLARFRA